MMEPRPTVYPCTECGHSERVFMCRPELARHGGVTMMRCGECGEVTRHRVFSLEAPTPDGNGLQPCARRAGR